MSVSTSSIKECFYCGTKTGPIYGAGKLGCEFECESCYTFFAEMNYYDYDDKSERIDEYLEKRREQVSIEESGAEVRDNST